MFILSVIPFTKIPFPAPQILDYVSGKKVSRGGIARISIGSRKVLGVVVSCAQVIQQKQQIKKFSFQLKQVDEILNPESIISKSILATALWASEYFYAPLGLVVKSLVPQILSHPTKKFLKELAERKLPKLNESGLPALEGPPAMPTKPILYCAQHSEPSKISFYKNAIKKTLKSRKSVLFLVPERYKIEYFQKKIPELQSISCVIGTRSALAFLPQNLGLIIVDEEESPFYKSFDQQPYIHAKEIALKLAGFVDAQIILGSDLPSFETLWKAKTGEYLTKSPKPKAKSQKLTIVDMREELKGGNYSILSRELQAQLREVLDKSKQAILFINRRGLSTGILCRDCGYVVKCPNCDVPSVFHNTTYTLICHHCGQKQRPPTICPTCKSYRIKFIGTGTQKVEQELQRFCKNTGIVQAQCRITRLDTDVAPKWSLQKKIFDDFKAKKYTILIGTQLMLKPELLPKVSLSAIITVDPLLSIPDFRMAEQIFRTIDKLESITLSKIILQTYNSENYVIQHVSSSLSTVSRDELENRKALSFPPFSQLIKLVYRHKNPQTAEQEAQVLKSKLQAQIANLALHTADCQLLGPAPAFIPRVKDRYIWQIMIKSKIKDLRLRNKLLQVVPSDWKIDVDPVEML